MRIGRRRSERIRHRNMAMAIDRLLEYTPPENQTNFVRNLMNPADRNVGNTELHGMIRALIQLALYFQPTLVRLFLANESGTVRLILRQGALFMKTYIF